MPTRRGNPERLHVPGHKGGDAADPELREVLGDGALALDIPALTWGIDTGPEPIPYQAAQELAAEAWGARRTWFLVNGASQANHVALLTLAHAGERIVTQRNAHSSTIDGCILAGLTPAFVDPEVDPELGIAHTLTPETLDRALVGDRRRGRRDGGLAHLLRRGRRRGGRWSRWPIRTACRWWSTRRGAPTCRSTRTCPAPALSLGADLVVSSTHKIVGSLTQSAMVHLGHGELIDEHVVDRCVTLLESTSPNSLLAGSLDAARRLAATRGRELVGETMEALAQVRAAVREIDGLDVLDERIVGAPGVYAYDPLRLAIDVRGTGAGGYELAALLRDRSGVMMELAGENVMVGVFGMAEHAVPQGERLVAALRDAVGALGDRGDRTREEFAPPPPWGEMAMSPARRLPRPAGGRARWAEAAGRIAAESLAAYPPGIPNVLPGERLTAETLDYIHTTLEHGGSLRGASDRKLETIRVVVE